MLREGHAFACVDRVSYVARQHSANRLSVASTRKGRERFVRHVPSPVQPPPQRKSSHPLKVETRVSNPVGAASLESPGQRGVAPPPGTEGV